jgi:hypothetical protein
MHKPLFCTLAFVIALSTSPATFAASQGGDHTTQNIYGGIHKDKPVMVIRFNSANVYYQMPLYNVVKKALQIYPGAFFELLSVIPSTGDYKTDEASSIEAHENLEKIGLTLDQIGLPRAKYEASYTTSSEITSNEVQIFVR